MMVNRNEEDVYMGVWGRGAGVWLGGQLTAVPALDLADKQISVTGRSR